MLKLRTHFTARSAIALALLVALPGPRIAYSDYPAANPGFGAFSMGPAFMGAYFSDSFSVFPVIPTPEPTPAPTPVPTVPPITTAAVVKVVEDAPAQIRRQVNPATQACTINNGNRTVSSDQDGGDAPQLAPASGNITYSKTGSVVRSAGHTEPLVSWNECEGRVRGFYNDSPDRPAACAKRGLSQTLAEKLDKHLLQCVQSASASVLHLPPGVPSNIQIGHMGLSPDAEHSPRSLHALGRAIDLNIIRFSADGKSYNFKYLDASKAYRMAKRGGASPSSDVSFAFFKSVENCWNTLNPPKGAAVNCTDPHHQDHLHLSVPLAPGSGFMVK